MNRFLFIGVFTTLFGLMGCREVNHQMEIGELEVEDRNERKGGGDDVMLGAIYFTSNFGVVGSSAVQSFPVRKLADNVGNGGTVPRTRTQALDFDWATFQTDATGTSQPSRRSFSQNPAEFWSEENGFSFEGVVFVAVEEDNVGGRILRNKFNTAVRRVEEALALYIEDPSYADTVNNFLTRPAHIEEKLECFQQYAENGSDCNVPGGLSGGSGGFLSNTNIGHDQIGTATILFIGAENPLLLSGIREAVTAEQWTGTELLESDEAPCGGPLASDFHVCEFIDGTDTAVNNTINLLFRGEGARWTLAVRNLTQIVE